MPDIARIPMRMDCSGGLDLVHPLDRMPPGSFGYLFNVRVLEEGRLDGRPGYTKLLQLSDQPNSIRRLNDPPKTFASNGYAYVGGGGPRVYAGPSTDYFPVDDGYSSNPLSLIPFRPDQSPEAWMYVYDSLKQCKVRPDKQVRAIGIVPPSSAPAIEYGTPANVDVSTGQSATSWSATGISASPTTTDRTAASSPVIAAILYDEGIMGWCCLSPSTSPSAWMGNRMKVILSGGSEEVLVRDVFNAIPNTTIDGILYDNFPANTGACALTLVGNPVGLQRNSLIQIAGETVRVLEVNLSPDGSTYSIRCVTVGSYNPGDAVTGLVSWYTYTTNNHSVSETISSHYIKATHSSAGVGAIQLSSNIDASRANGRPIDPANDYLHISVYLQNPQNVLNLQILLSLDSTPNFSFTNPGNSYIWTVPQSQLQFQGSSNASWAEIVLPISDANRSGDDPILNLSNITGIAIQMNSSAACDYGFDWWYLTGTYGPLIIPNSPVGLVYQYRYRDSTTGAKSVPGPQTRYQLFPLRESVIITPSPSSQTGVDTIDIYRQGGAVTTPLYVGSAENSVSAQLSYTDILPDSSVLAANQPPDLAALQPWPLLDQSWSGECTVVGTSVYWNNGHQFNTALLSNSVILIEGTPYLTYGQPRSPFFLEITQNAGYLASANFQIAAPTLAGQPLAFAFGALEGPFAPVIFALGDPLNGGTLYFSNFNDADGASDANTIELTSPSSSLVSGAVWNGIAFAGSKDDLFAVRYAYLSGISQQGGTAFQWAPVDVPSGIWSRWACCSCPLGIAYLGTDGIYIATDSGGVCITDEKLYPMFPHDGVPAKVSGYGSDVIYPVDMTQIKFLRLTYCDSFLHFSYLDTVGNANTLIYDIDRKRWFLNNYAHGIGMAYLEEYPEEGPNLQDILMLSLNTNAVMMSGGNDDNGEVINSIVLTPCFDGGDQREQKLYVDTMTMAGGTGTIDMAATYNNAQAFSPVVSFTCVGAIQQFLENIASLADLSLYRNIGAKFAWTGGPDGPQLYAWETSGYNQPYLSTHFVTQFLTFSFPGWKHLRRMFPALISNSDITFTIKSQNGHIYGPYTISSTAGQFRILPQMLDTNIKDLAFALELDGGGQPFALFPSDFVLEAKEWTEETYIMLAVFRT